MPDDVIGQKPIVTGIDVDEGATARDRRAEAGPTDASATDNASSIAPRSTTIERVAPVVTIVLAIGIWYLTTVTFAGPGSNLVAFNPADTARSFTRLFIDGTIWADARISLFRLVSGLSIAAVLGITVGCITGAVRVIDRATTPLFQFIRMISPVAWTPVAIVLFGVGDAPAITLIALTAVWPLMLSTSAGVKAIPTGWLALARSLGANRREVFTSIVVPAVRVPVLTGLRVALGVGWIVLVPVEMLGANRGLGYAIMNAKDALAYDNLLATIIVVGILGFVLDSGLRLLISRATPDISR